MVIVIAKWVRRNRDRFGGRCDVDQLAQAIPFVNQKSSFEGGITVWHLASQTFCVVLSVNYLEFVVVLGGISVAKPPIHHAKPFSESRFNSETKRRLHQTGGFNVCETFQNLESTTRLGLHTRFKCL